MGYCRSSFGHAHGALFAGAGTAEHATAVMFLAMLLSAVVAADIQHERDHIDVLPTVATEEVVPMETEITPARAQGELTLFPDLYPHTISQQAKRASAFAAYLVSGPHRPGFSIGGPFWYAGAREAFHASLGQT